MLQTFQQELWLIQLCVSLRLPAPQRCYTESDLCTTLLTSIVFQRQPPGGKQGKQLIHPHSVHKQTV